MSTTRILGILTGALQESGIPFMLTGSVAAAWYGAGRATMDIDLVIDATPAQLDALLQRLDRPGLYVSREAAHQALADRSMFNVVDVETGWKADLILRRSRPFSETEFDRRVAGTFEGLQLWLPTIEDLIVAKLEWAKLGNSARQIEDVRALMSIAGKTLDLEQVRGWVEQLGLQQQWQLVRT